MTDTDNRLHALEARIAHQDNVIEDLSDVLAKQWKEISQLNGRIDYLKRKLQEGWRRPRRATNRRRITEFGTAKRPAGETAGNFCGTGPESGPETPNPREIRRRLG